MYLEIRAVWQVIHSRLKQEFDWSSFLLGNETLEGAYLKKLDGTVEFFLGIIFFVLCSWNSNSHFSWNISAASRPEEMVKSGVNSNILDSKKIRLLLKN